MTHIGGEAVRPGSDDAWIGRMVGGCRIIRKLGRGGMGAVFAGVQETLERPVAIKILDLSPEGRGAPSAKPPPATPTAGGPGDSDPLRRRIDREARVLGMINHPNVVNVHLAGWMEDRFFLVMEYVEGRSVRRILEEEGRIGWRRACRILLDAARGLEAVWARGIIHRDIKPDNILVPADGPAKVVDFGLALPPGLRRRERAVFEGTAAYASPETVRGFPIDVRSDIYSLGVTFWEMLAGFHPFEGDTMSQVLWRHAQEAVPDVRPAVGDLPEALVGLVTEMTRKAPADRPQAPSDVVRTLLPFVPGERPREAAVMGRPTADPLKELERIRHLRRLRIDHDAPDASLEALVKEVAGLFRMPVCMVNLVLEDRQYFKVWQGPLPEELAETRGTRREDSICTYVVASREPVVIDDFHAHDEWRRHYVCVNYGIRFYAGFPIVGAGGHALGSLCLLDVRPNSISEREREVLQAFADRVGVTLELGAARRAAAEATNLAPPAGE